MITNLPHTLHIQLFTRDIFFPVDASYRSSMVNSATSLHRQIEQSQIGKMGLHIAIQKSNMLACFRRS